MEIMRMRLSNAIPQINDAKNTANETENKSIRMRRMNAVLLDWRPKRTAHVRVATACDAFFLNYVFTLY